MNPAIILDIIKLSLEFAIKVHDDIPEGDRRQFWIDHEKRVQFWSDLFAKLQGA